MGILLIHPGSANTAPHWWTQGSVRPTGNQPLAVANIGQAKFMAKSALDELRKINPRVASEIESDLVGTGKPIVSWSAPTPGTLAAAQQYSPLAVGQLKAIAAPFYAKLHATNSTWLSSQRATNGTQDAANPSNFYPWTSATADDANFAIATTGQLKAVFALRFDVDSNGDSIPDLFESDRDGLTPEQEALLGTSPLLDDTDGDGVPDHLDAFPLDPTRWAVAPPVPGDTTPPIVTLSQPTTATFVSGP